MRKKAVRFVLASVCVALLVAPGYAQGGPGTAKKVFDRYYSGAVRGSSDRAEVRLIVYGHNVSKDPQTITVTVRHGNGDIVVASPNTVTIDPDRSAAVSFDTANNMCFTCTVEVLAPSGHKVALTLAHTSATGTDERLYPNDWLVR